MATCNVEGVCSGKWTQRGLSRISVVPLGSTEAFYRLSAIVLALHTTALLFSFSRNVLMDLFPDAEDSCFHWKISDNPRSSPNSQADEVSDWLVSIAERLEAERARCFSPELVESKTKLKGEWILDFKASAGKKHNLNEFCINAALIVLAIITICDNNIVLTKLTEHWSNDNQTS